MQLQLLPFAIKPVSFVYITISKDNFLISPLQTKILVDSSLSTFIIPILGTFTSFFSFLYILEWTWLCLYVLNIYFKNGM